LYRDNIKKAIQLKKPFEEYLFWKNLHLHTVIIPIADDKTGNISSVGALVYDISERINDKQKIHESEQRFISIFNNSKDAILLLSIELEIVEVNDEFYNLFGSKDFPRKNVIQSFFPPKYQTLIIEQVNYLRSGISIPTLECEIYNVKKEKVPVEISTSVVTLNNKPHLLTMARDISIHKEMRRLLAKASSHIENRERRKLASDLHDNVGPLLSSMNMYLSVLARKEELQPHKEILDDIKRIIKDTITSVREISNNLSPQILLNFGLTAALEYFFETKQKLITIDICNSIGALRFDELKESMIYNIVIEAFNNTLKHSGADKIKLDIYLNNNNLNLAYSDNGSGFILSDQLKASDKSMGLLSIINRIKVIDGNYSIETAPGKGFLLKIVGPINLKEECDKNSNC